MEQVTDLDLFAADLKVKPRRRALFSSKLTWFFMKLVLIAGCAAGLLATLSGAVQSAREAARRAQCLCNLCSIKLALHNYHSTHGTLPPAYVADATGKPMHSWRLLILPFMEESALYEQYDFNEPWDGPNNIKLLDRTPAIFRCPSRSSEPTPLTSYVVFTGPGTMFPGANPVKFEDVTDGLPNTLMVGEVSNVNIPWTAPQDLDVRTMSFQINDRRRSSLSSKHPGGVNVVFGDASTRFLPQTITPGLLRALITIAGHEGATVDQIFP
jgi:Protein of unknown function (DUF1559)